MAFWFRQLNQQHIAKRRKRRAGIHLEALEHRFALTGFCDLGTCVSIEMLPEFDTFGNQIETIQAYGEGDDALVALSSIYDTGASVITWSANDQALFQFGTDPLNPIGGIPVKVPDGAQADAIGGPLIGDVSEPGVIRAEGLHALQFGDGVLDFGVQFQNPARAEGVQSFIGTTSGSPSLPTITGVPIHYPSPAHTTGVAARIDMNAFEYDLGAMFPEFGDLFEGLSLFAPDIFFVDPDQTLEGAADTTDPIRVPLSLIGGDNHADPGDMITYTDNPVQDDVYFRQGSTEVSDKTLLFDTGAQLSVFSTEIALQLGFDPNAPQMTIDVQGAAGSASIPGFIVDELQLPIDNDGDGTYEGGLQFNNVAVFVLDLGFGLDGILGMNLFNTADVMLYDPFDAEGPSLQTRFFTDLVREEITLDESDFQDENGNDVNAVLENGFADSTDVVNSLANGDLFSLFYPVSSDELAEGLFPEDLYPDSDPNELLIDLFDELQIELEPVYDVSAIVTDLFPEDQYPGFSERELLALFQTSLGVELNPVRTFMPLGGSLPTAPKNFSNLGLSNPISEATIVGRHLFHNNSVLDGTDPAINAADDNAIATNLSPLYPAGTGNSENISSAIGGITGVMIDVLDLADPSAFSAADVEFRIGDTDSPSSWDIIAPTSVSVREGAGLGGAERIAFTFDTGAISNTWLEVRLKAGEATGLEFDDVFYYGNQAADVNGDGAVDALDFNEVRANPHNFLDPASAGSNVDINHDTNVNTADMILVRDNTTNIESRLSMITPPPTNLGKGFTASLNVVSHVSDRVVIVPEVSDSSTDAADAEPVEIMTTEATAAVDPNEVDRLMAAFANSTSDSSADSSDIEVVTEEADELDVCFPASKE